MEELASLLIKGLSDHLTVKNATCDMQTANHLTGWLFFCAIKMWQQKKQPHVLHLEGQRMSCHCDAQQTVSLGWWGCVYQEVPVIFYYKSIFDLPSGLALWPYPTEGISCCAVILEIWNSFVWVLVFVVVMFPLSECLPIGGRGIMDRNIMSQYV